MTGSAPDNNPYEAPARDAVEARDDAAFAPLNRATRFRAAGQAAFALLCAAITALAGYFVAPGLIGLLVGVGVGVALGASYLFSSSKRWVRLVEGGVTLGGQFVPWADVFFAESSAWGRQNRMLNVCFVEGGQPRMVSVRVRVAVPDWAEVICGRIRPWERLDEVERTFIRKMVGASPDGEPWTAERKF
jgi:hypothetical protein